MPKRKRQDNCEYIRKKIRKLQRKLDRSRQRKHRYRSEPSDSESCVSSPPESLQLSSDAQENDILAYDLLSDEDPDPGPSTSGQNQDKSVRSAVIVPAPAESVEQQMPLPSTLNENQDTPSNPVVTPGDAPKDSDVIQSINSVTPATEEISLDGEILEILGIDPSTVKKYGKEIQKDLSIRLEHCVTAGLDKELRKEFKEKYLTPENCKLIDPPELNAEIKAAISETVAKRDKAIESKQKQITLAISCLGEAITQIISSKEKNTPLLKLLMDAIRIMCDCQYTDSLTRRNFLLTTLKRDMKQQLQNTKIDKFLFGENLSDTLKSAKAINKSGAELKQIIPKVQNTYYNKKTTQNSSNTSKNWKNQGPTRRQVVPQKTKEPATTSTRNQPNNSSKPSYHQQRRTGYTRR